MVNIIHAAEDGKSGDPGQYRDYVFPAPGISRGKAALHSGAGT
jgi:hypothetical protein